MFCRPFDNINPDSTDFETTPLVTANGFRDYDVRWWFGYPGCKKNPEINLMGVQVLGVALGTLIQQLNADPKIIVGHDFRSYSMSVKHALITGLIAAGAQVKDIGLALSPTAYYAQFALNIPSVAMVTASHNDNGWTGLKMGCNWPLTFGPDEIHQLKKIVFEGLWNFKEYGSYELVPNFSKHYINFLADRKPIKRKLKLVVACGNGTAGFFAPEVFRQIGYEVIPIDTRPDYNFPNYNPNPEDIKMLCVIQKAVLQHNADIGFGFDGDGDRCGVIDNEGQIIFSDKVGVILARDIGRLYPGAKFIADIKSTCLFKTDPVLCAQKNMVEYYKTGHSHIKQRMQELNAIAGFEKSGHFFFNKPIGYGYDDGILAAIAICDMLERHTQLSMSDFRRSLPMTYGSPTIFFDCSDKNKHVVVARVVDHFLDMFNKGISVGGQKIVDLIIIDGIRIVTEDGTWGLIRASSNMPQLVLVVESPVSEKRRIDMFQAMDAILQKNSAW